MRQFQCNLGVVWTQETLPAAGITNGIQHMQFINATLGFSGGNLGTFLRYGNPSGISLNNNEVPEGFELKQNYPNPFNPSTKINFSIPKASNVSLKIYDALGKEIYTLVNEFKAAGNYSYEFNVPSDITSGVYFYTLSSENFTSTKKLTLVK
ncbi:MAG: T9SS type A sorting domain-containing protein [Ignavibacteria bacterium]|nr:T9SS type A sorting domain-containing protein [Ignavibacteria bacterium]